MECVNQNDFVKNNNICKCAFVEWVTLYRVNSANRVPVVKENKRLVKITEIYHRSFHMLVYQLVLLK